MVEARGVELDESLIEQDQGLCMVAVWSQGTWVEKLGHGDVRGQICCSSSQDDMLQ